MRALKSHMIANTTTRAAGTARGVMAPTAFTTGLVMAASARMTGVPAPTKGQRASRASSR